MGKLRYLFTTLSALTFGAGTYSVQAAITAEDIERDCKLALQEKSIEAFEAFFLKYPPHQYRGKDIACYTMALSAYNSFSPVDSRNEVATNPPSGGYGN